MTGAHSPSKIRFLAVIGLILLAHFGVAQETDSPFWPAQINSSKGTVTMYQPQPESLKGDQLESRAAISIKLKDETELVFGAIWLTSYLEIDRDQRLATLLSAKVNDIRLPEVFDSTKIDVLKSFIETEMLQWDFEMNYDELLATLENIDVTGNQSFDNSAPKIIFRESGAILIVIDGEPKFKSLEKNYEQLINAPAFILKKKTKYFLYGGDMWFQSKDEMKTWSRLKNPPTQLKMIKNEYYKNPQDPLTIKPDIAPEIIIADRPTELVITEGPVQFSPIPKTKLLFVENTGSDLFLDINTQSYYILLSGRWFSANSLDGPWQYVAADQISEEFAKIPESSIKGDVLASVPGTQAAKEALLDASIPETAAIERGLATASVVYDGDPKFETIEDTQLQYAVNTSSAVFKSKDIYYLCDNAVWFQSSSPHGEWIVSDVRPTEIDQIPASHPFYNVKYVYIYETTPEVVYVGYTPGYVGCYAYGPTVVYGTGFYYSGWYGPHYYPRPVTYGFSVRYSPYHGWSMGVSIGFGGAGYWYHGRGYWGPPMYRPPYYSRRYTERHRSEAGDRRPSNQPAASRNLYKNRQNGVRATTRPGSGASPSTRPATSDRSRPSNPANRAANTGKSRPSNNVYSDRNGNVYRKGNDGWESRQNNQWNKPSQQPNQNLNQSYQNRNRGAQRSQNYMRTRPATGRTRR
ncbi:hypothetical protein [Reichenbachiella sp.]